MSFGPHTWPAGTRVQLVRVPWDSSYRDLVSWSAKDRAAWFDQQVGHAVTIDRVSYLPYGRPVRLPLHVDDLQKYNYLRVTNNFRGEVRDYYYFIHSAEYVSPDTSHVHIQLDVWQTWQDGLEFRNCFVERGHVGLADFKSRVNADSRYGQAVLNVPEGLDTGSHLPVTSQLFVDLSGDGPSGWVIMVTSTIDLTSDPGSATEPKVTMSFGNNIEMGGDAGSIYFFDLPAHYQNLLNMFRDYPHVTQGIISSIAIPSAVFEAIKTNYGLTQKNISNPNPNISGSVPVWTSGGTVNQPVRSTIVNEANFRDKFKIPQRYRHLHKFKTFPYAAIELTNFAGQTIYIEPDRVWSNDLNIEMLASVRPSDPRMVFYPAKYGAETDETTNTPPSWSAIDPGEFLNMSIVNDNFPRFSVLNNTGMMYMLSNARSIAHQRDSVNWSQTKALAGAELSFEQASKAQEVSQRLTDSNITAMDQTRALNNTTNAAQSIVGGANALASGNPASAVLGAANAAAGYAIQRNVNETSFNIASSQARRGASIAQDQIGFNRDTNYAFAEYAAKGDAANAIAGINARIQDSQVVSPGVLGATGGDALLMFYRIMGVSVRYRQITHSAMRIIGEFWLRFGYFVQMFVRPPSDLHVMSKFSYWKMRDAYVVSRGAPEDVCATMRGVLERGTTVWRTPGDIGNVDMGDNEPIVKNYLNLKNANEEW